MREEKRQERREERVGGEVQRSLILIVFAAAEEILEGDLIADVQIAIVEIKFIYKFNFTFWFSLPFVSLCLQSQATQFQDQESASRPPDFTARYI